METSDAGAKNETILVVEDNSAARIALEAILDAMGYRVLMAADSDEALALFHAQPDAIDLVISDLILPRITGPELYDMLKAERPNLPILIMSGYPLDEETERLQQHGIKNWIQKPFNMKQLADGVGAALACRQA
jgi:two-component system cell cycle sensor histidine kinase/response regulator CckA